MPNKYEWINSLENENKQYDEYLKRAKEAEELVPHIQERKKETEAKITFVRAVPEEFLVELGDTLYILQRHDEEQAKNLVPKLPKISKADVRILASGTTDTSAYAELSNTLQVYQVDNDINGAWIPTVTETFSTLASSWCETQGERLGTERSRECCTEM